MIASTSSYSQLASFKGRFYRQLHVACGSFLLVTVISKRAKVSKWRTKDYYGIPLHCHGEFRHVCKCQWNSKYDSVVRIFLGLS